MNPASPIVARFRREQRDRDLTWCLDQLADDVLDEISCLVTELEDPGCALTLAAVRRRLDDVEGVLLDVVPALRAAIEDGR